MRALILFVILALTLSFASSAFAADDENPNMRQSRHVIMPFIGYQVLNGEQVGYEYESYVPQYLFFSDTTISASRKIERDSHSPVIGAAYRYNFMPPFFAELSLGVMLNGETIVHAGSYEIWTYPVRFNIGSSRSNTYVAAVSGAGSFNLPLKWLTADVHGGVGYAWREIKVNPSLEFMKPDIELYDTAQMLRVNGGFNLNLWRGDIIAITGGLQYTHFIPLDTGIDSFGGMGWQFSLFPVWSNIR